MNDENSDSSGLFIDLYKNVFCGVVWLDCVFSKKGLYATFPPSLILKRQKRNSCHHRIQSEVEEQNS